MNRYAYKKKMYLTRLRTWENELITNRYNQQHYAEKAIKILKTDIEDFWPGTLKQLEKPNGS